MARILIIDDDNDFGELTRRRLDKAGFETTYKDSPFGSLNEIRKGSYDVVIVDIRMPALDGAALVRLIRESGQARGTRILLCSSIDFDELTQLSMVLAADGYISKSASGTELIDKLTDLLDPAGPASRRVAMRKSRPPPR